MILYLLITIYVINAQKKGAYVTTELYKKKEKEDSTKHWQPQGNTVNGKIYVTIPVATSVASSQNLPSTDHFLKKYGIDVSNVKD